MQADGHKEDVDLRWQRWATHMDALILITLTHSGILSQVSSSTLYWLQQRMRERVKLGGADEEKGGWEKEKQQCTKGGRGAWGTQSVRELKRGSDSAEERGDSRLDGPSGALMEHGSGFRVLPLQWVLPLFPMSLYFSLQYVAVHILLLCVWCIILVVC